MNRSLLPLLRCPNGCDLELNLHAASNRGDWIDTGWLGCDCGAEYRIEEGVPRMLPRHLTNPDQSAIRNPQSEIQQLSEMRARDEQAGDYDRMWHLNLFGLIEIPAMLASLSLGTEHTLLEAGCGTGRMSSTFAARCSRLISIDFSWESLRACARKLQRAGIRNADLIQADICHLPLRSFAFDRVVSGQVLEHIPAGARESAVDELARVLKAGGNLSLSAYQYSLLMRLFGEKEGEHAGGIYFYRFERDELRDLLSRALHVEGITGALVYHYIARCRKGVGSRVSGVG